MIATQLPRHPPIVFSRSRLLLCHGRLLRSLQRPSKVGARLIAIDAFDVVPR
jgi:hypothetical protein